MTSGRDSVRDVVVTQPDRSRLLVRPGAPTDAAALAHCRTVSWEATYRGLLPDVVMDVLGAQPEGERWLWLHDARGGELPDGTRLAVAEYSSADGVRPPKLVGFVVTGPPRSTTHLAPEWWELQSIYVLPDFWSSGAGSMLITDALGSLPEATRRVFLWMLESNSRAAHFYARWGFEPEDLSSVDIAGAPVPHRRMIKAVRPHDGDRVG